MKCPAALRGPWPYVFRCPRRAWVAATAFAVALLTPLAGMAGAGGAIAVKVSDKALLPGASALPAGLHAAVEAAFGVSLSPGGRTPDGAFVLDLPAPLGAEALRAALNRVRLDPAVLYANAAPGAPVPATQGRPTDRLIVKYRDAGANLPAQADSALDSARIARVSAAAGDPVAWMRRGVMGSHVLQMFTRMPIAEVEAVAARIALDPDVEYAQPDYIRTAQLVPTDPCYASASVAACNGGYQWDLFDPVGGINMPGAWAITTGAVGIRVAVIDTGALASHPDLAGRFVGGYDMIADCAVANDADPGPCTWSSETPDMSSRDPNAADAGDWVTTSESSGLGSSQPPYDWFQGCQIHDSTWHGTHVAGTIGAVANNGIGVAGINWVSQIVPLRVLGKCGGYTSDISAAMVWAAGGNVPGTPANANPARVLNLSLGGSGPCDSESQGAINTALGLGAVVVVAAGNENDNANNHSPANCSGVITVAATTKLGKRARYSNYGSKVEIAAPGGNADGVDPDILSTLNSSTTIPGLGSYIYVRYAGTSMATPHVAGVASLMLSVNATLTPAQVLSKMQSTVRAFPTPGPVCNPTPQNAACNCTTALCGAGILDAAAAVASAIGASASLASSANPAGAGATITFTMTVTGNAPTGTVKFEDGATTLAGCGAVALAGTGNTRTAACVTSTLTVGSHAMKSSYSGDGSNAPSSATLTQAVIVAATTTLASSQNPSFAGTTVTFTAIVAGTAPTGTVGFTSNGATMSGCGAVALTGSGNARTASCTPSPLTTGSFTIAANYSGDAGNAASSASLTQVIAQPIPGNATVTLNPYGTLSVTGATMNGNSIFNISGNFVVQLGSIPGTPGSPAWIDFQSLNLGPGNKLTVRSGAPGQLIILNNTGAAGSAFAGMLAVEGGNGAPPPILYVKNGKGVNVTTTGSISAPTGLVLDTLGATWTTGEGIVNQGNIDGGPDLGMQAARINGGGQFRGNAITIRAFGHANNPVNGAFFLQNGLQLFPSSGNAIALTLNGYSSTPQVFNLFMNGNATVWMPSAWPAGYNIPANNTPVPAGGTRPAGTPPPGYGGGSMILQASGTMTLVNGGTNDFVFPGAIVLKSLDVLNLNGVVVNQGWTTSGQSFQGVFFESPTIMSSNGNIQVYGNDLNWINFSTFPQAYARVFSLKANPDTSASFVPTDLTTPHLNTYSVIQNTAASGGCWTCIINSQPIYIYGP